MTTHVYDYLIREASDHYLPQWDWRWLLAQGIAESGMNPKAVSPVGAQGLFQFMPQTWRDVSKALKFPDLATPFYPGYAAKAAAYYMGTLRAAWKAQRPEEDRRRLAQASYNAGLGNILKAQKLANNAPDYQTIIDQLHNVTGDQNAAETRGYVVRIDKLYRGLDG